METIMKQIRRLFLLFCLITAGAQCTWAYYSYYQLDNTVTINNLKYDLFSYYAYEVNGYVHTIVESRHYACLVDILGTNEEVVIPGKIGDNGVEYTVNTIGALIENNSIKSLTFQGFADFFFNETSWRTGIDASGNNTYKYQEYSGFIKSTSLQTIEFKAGISEWNFKGARLLCPNLRHVVFSSLLAPTFSGTWSNYCTAPASNVTAVVPIWSQETCENKQLTATVWCEFKGVVPSLDLVHDATLKSNGGGDVQIWKNKNNKSQLDYTMSSEGGEELVTFYGNVDSYQVRVFCSSDYSKPVLKRNGTEVNLEAASGYYYYDETSHMSVTSYEVVYNANYSRRLHFLNFGNGTVELSGESNGSAVSYVAEGMTETDYTFDKRTPVSVTITPQEGYKVQRIEHYGRIALPFTLNETTGVATTQYNFDDNESEQSLKIYYQKKVIPEGSPFRVRMSVEGAGGAGAVFYSNDGSYYWIDDEIDDNGFGYQIDPGESDEVIGRYDPDDAIMDFYVKIYLTPAEAAAGFVTTVKVYANGGLVECSNPGTEWGDYYRIPLDGGDMDVRVVFESNGRYLTGENGNGGNVAIYCEGSNTPLRIEAPGYWFWTLIPKTANPYVVITPIAGKTVVAVVRDGKLLSSLNNYRQSDGTYRIPLEGFDKGDSGYPLYVVYGDDISSVPNIEWNLLMVGDVDEANNENPKANVLWMVDGSDFLSVSEGASLNASGNIDKTYNLPTNTYLDFYIYVKPGQTFKASFNGTDVTNIFNRNANYDNDDGTLCYVYEARGYEQFATDGTWVVEFKNADSGGSNEVVAVLTPDRNTPLYLTNSSGEDVLFAFLNTEIGTITKGGDYTIKVRSYNPHSWKTNLRVNGVDRTADLVTNSENANEMLLPLTNITESLNVEAFYTSRRSIVSLYTTEGGTTKIEYTDNKTGEAASRTYSNGDYSNDRIVNGTEVIFTFTPDQGYKLSKVFAMSDRWIGEGDDYEVKLQADGSYRFVLSSGDFIDGLASITVHFEKKGGPYDVNNDGNITIGDVTKLVNVILGKE